MAMILKSLLFILLRKFHNAKSVTADDDHDDNDDDDNDNNNNNVCQ
jgi:hypothetical protein